MPCSDGYDREWRKPCDNSSGILVEFYMKKAAALENRCDELASLLCSVGRARHNQKDIPPEVLTWWDRHCELDRQRGEPW